MEYELFLKDFLASLDPNLFDINNIKKTNVTENTSFLTTNNEKDNFDVEIKSIISSRPDNWSAYFFT